MKNVSFITRETESIKKDYISIVNDVIKEHGTIDPNGLIYQNALTQYNEGLIKGSVDRLEVPDGFCGYIDPASGEFRVEPIVGADLRISTTPYPNNAVRAEDVPNIVVEPYPIDKCLAVGLPGSYEYTTGLCGEDDGDNECSGIKWFSGGGEDSEFGTEAAEAVVCNKDGDGINSNTGIAASDPIVAIDDDIPALVRIAGDEYAVELFGGGFNLGVIGNILQDIVTYHLFYNIMFAGAFLLGGLKVMVGWDTKNEKPVGNIRSILLTVSGGNQTFLWKEKNEAGNALVILLPSSYLGTPTCSIYNNNGTNLLETAPMEALPFHDGRPAYRFEKLGYEYGTNLTVIAGNGKWAIPDGGTRTEY